MKTQEIRITDAEGYLTIPNKYFDKGFNFEFIKDLGNDWRIYRMYKDYYTRSSYELVKIHKREGYEMAGNVIPKKWSYPSSEQWGIYGFTYNNIEDCEKKYSKILTKPKK